MICLKRTAFVFSTALAVLFAVEASAVAQGSFQRVATGLSSPLYGTFAPGDTDRMFMLEQGSAGTARIKILDLNTSSVLATPFLTISGLSTGGERGLLGLAFDPDYSNNGNFYIYGSYPGGLGGNHTSRIRRYTVNGDPATSNTADAGSVFDVMSFTQPFSNHNGGWIGFDPTSTDPYLYISTGDGGSGGDPQNNSQDITNNPLGKFLRIDVSGDDFTSTAQNYAIPASNPFVGTTGDDEIWSYGIRNAWRSSFDRETGDLWIGDVGQNAREEINVQPADSPGGENYGWRVLEGLNCFDNSQAGGNPTCNDPGFTDPVYTYGHNGGNFGGFSVTGGYVYRGSVAEYEGLYFFADFATNNVWTIDPYAENIQASVIRRNGELPTSAGSLGGVSSFAEDANGEMYLFSFNGQVFRVESSTRDAVWNGDAAVGSTGDATDWNDANNWTRDGNIDQQMVSSDRVIFAPGSSSQSVNMQGDRTVGAAVIQADYTFGGGALTVLSGNIDVSSGATARFNDNIGAQDADNSIRKLGAGRLYVNATTPQVAVLDGYLGGSGTVNTINVYDGGGIAPGDGIGQLNSNNVEMRPGSSLEIEINGMNSFDVLSVSGPAVIDGSLNVEGMAYTPANRGDVEEFMFLVATSVTGNFDDASYNGTALDLAPGNTHTTDGLFVGYNQTSTDASVYLYYALPGDANGDGIVDGLDFIEWNESRFQSGTDWTSGDFNGDGITDGLDFIIWNDNRFTSVPLPSVVPEPTSLAMIAMLLGICGFRRRAS